MLIRPDKFYFYQFTKEEAWRECTGTALMGSSAAPLYHTVLGREEHYAEGVEQVYSGPAYFDIDVSLEFGGIAVAIIQMNALLDKLEAAGVNLDSLYLYCSGGKGFHVEIPPETFRGVASPVLPALYKELALAFYVDGVDMVVYSARRGRMWRCANVKRENGRYKVQVSPAEVRSLTAERYAEFVESPRPPPPVSPPEYCAGMALAFSKARDKIAKTQDRPKPASGALFHRFKGKLPQSVGPFLQGRAPSPKGWNQVALQLAILGRECGIQPDGLVHACRGLIDSHVSDGRHRTPGDRERALIEMCRYTGTTGYGFSTAGLKSVLPTGYRLPDFRGLK
ncbi:MAG: hypothetical protein ACYC2E_05175 [Sulfuricella sp.]